MGTTSAIRGKRFKTSVLILGTAFCATLLWNYPYLAFERSVRQAAEWHLDDLSVIVDYLSPPLSDKNYGKFWKRSEVVAEILERYRVSNRPDEYVELFNASEMEGACASPERMASPWLEALCEWRILSQSGQKTVDCDTFANSEARAECRRSNDSKFSVESSDHCSKADCLIDNAVFRTATKGTSACPELPEPLIGSCERIFDSYESYSKNPQSLERPELENALLGKTDDPTWIAAREAVLENPDSPSDECRNLDARHMEECETKTKALFSYVQLRGLKNRLKAISEAVKEQEKNHGKP